MLLSETPVARLPTLWGLLQPYVRTLETSEPGTILSDLPLRPVLRMLAHLPFIPFRKALSVFPPPRNRPRLGVPSGSLSRQAGHSPPSPFRTSVRPSGIFPYSSYPFLSPFGSLFPFCKGVPRADSPRRECPLGSLQSSYCSAYRARLWVHSPVQGSSSIAPH